MSNTATLEPAEKIASPSPPTNVWPIPEAGSLRLHPRFHEAIRSSTLGALTFHEDLPHFSKIFNDLPTLVTGMLAIHLDATDRLHHRGLQSLSSRPSIVSAGRATALLWRMQSLGFIQPADAFQSGKVRRYKPLPSMVDAFRRRIAIDIDGLAMLDPRAAALRRRLDDIDEFNRYIGRAVRSLLRASPEVLESFQPLGEAAFRAMGMLIVYSIVAQIYARGGTLAEGVVEVSLSSLSRQFDVSRIHVRRVLRSLEAVGLVNDRAVPQRFTLTPRFREGFEVFHAGIWTSVTEQLDAADAEAGALAHAEPLSDRPKRVGAAALQR